MIPSQSFSPTSPDLDETDDGLSLTPDPLNDRLSEEEGLSTQEGLAIQEGLDPDFVGWNLSPPPFRLHRLSV